MDASRWLSVREAVGPDIPNLADLFRSAALEAGPEHYTSQQVRAWADFADEDEAFRHFILKATTLIAHDETGIVGFGGIEPDGHIASLYVRPDRLRRGVGSMLLSRLVEMAGERGVVRLYAETNLLSRPLFEQFGFEWTDTETVSRGDAVFERYIVERYV